MPFDREAEGKELEFRIELVFNSVKSANGLPIQPSAYIAMGSFPSDQSGRPMITNKEMSFGPLKSQVEYIKACLDARLMDAKARFMAAGVDV
jgi:hypothetical protein